MSVPQAVLQVVSEVSRLRRIRGRRACFRRGINCGEDHEPAGDRRHDARGIPPNGDDSITTSARTPPMLREGMGSTRAKMSHHTLHLRFPRIARVLLLAALAFALMGAASTSPQPTANSSFAQVELDGLLAPIALYPDGLLTQVLMASTYPLEIVEADRFLKKNPSLQGDALDEALAKRTWDPSVQSLAAYPQVLAMMSDKLEWTERLGNAVLEDQARVMDTVQGLRRRAESTGNLQSSDKQTVVHEKQTIIVQPAQKEVVYVAEYDPAVVYGTAWYAAASYYHEHYYGHGSYGVSVSYSSYRVSASHYGWASANWQERSVSVDGRGNRFWSNSGRAQNLAGTWQHDPAHRGSVDYPSSALRDRIAEGKPSPKGLEPPGGASRPRPSGPLDSARAPLASLPDRGLPGPSSLPVGGPPNFGSGGPPTFGGGGPHFGGGLPGPPPPPPFPH